MKYGISRYAMEKMRMLDGKLKFQIDRLLNFKNMDPQDAKNAILRPNLTLDDDYDDNDDDDMQDYNDVNENEDEISDVDVEDLNNSDHKKVKQRKVNSTNSDNIYKPPKLAPMPYNVWRLCFVFILQYS